MMLAGVSTFNFPEAGMLKTLQFIKFCSHQSSIKHIYLAPTAICPVFSGVMYLLESSINVIDQIN